MSDGYTILTLDEVDTAPHRENTTLIPVRHHLGFRAAGVNAWKADTGGRLIPPHEEDSGNEELYVVVSGRATFTVGDEEADATAGSLVFVPAEVFRTAIAAEDGTIVLVVGATVGEAFSAAAGTRSPSRTPIGRRAGSTSRGRSWRSRSPPAGPWGPRYNAGCLEALGGDADAALEHLRRAKELDTDGRSRSTSARTAISTRSATTRVFRSCWDESRPHRRARRDRDARRLRLAPGAPPLRDPRVRHQRLHPGASRHRSSRSTPRGSSNTRRSTSSCVAGCASRSTATTTSSALGQLVCLRDPSLQARRGGGDRRRRRASDRLASRARLTRSRHWEYVFAAVPHIQRRPVGGGRAGA